LVTVVLSSWRRPHYLAEQIACLRGQSLPPEEIWIWADSCDENRSVNHESLGADRVFVNSSNLGVYGRFAVALLARTNYVAIFDDDTMPGRCYLENCLQTIRARRGIVAASGVQFTSASYRPCLRFGWAKRTADVTEVDVGCNAWFLERSWLAYLWLEPPANWHNGEDMRLSYLAQKYGGIRTFTPPQVEDEMCGSLAGARGWDEVAVSQGADHYRTRTEQLAEQLSKGWTTVRGVRLSGH
jgi:hypothetical protein